MQRKANNFHFQVPKNKAKKFIDVQNYLVPNKLQFTISGSNQRVLESTIHNEENNKSIEIDP